MENKILNPREIVDFVRGVGIEKSSRKVMQNLFLGIMAGIFIALGGFAAGIASHSISNYGVSRIVAGVVFPVGLILVLICGAELFTGNTLMVLSYFDDKISIKGIMKNWITVYLGNMIGAFFISTLLFWSGALDINNGAFGVSILKVAVNKVNISFGQGIASGILCNILVCSAVWGSYASKEVMGKIWMSIMPIMAFVIAGFEHCVANMYYLSLGLMAKNNIALVQSAQLAIEKLDKLNITGIIENLLPVTIGNIIGGSLIIAGIYWFVFRGIDKKKS